MDVYTDRSVSRLEIVDTGGRRRFSDAAKLRIVAESYSGRRLGSATARKYGITGSQLADWRNAARAGRLSAASLRLIFKLYLNGEATSCPLGIKEIAKTLNRRGIRTRLGARFGVGPVHKTNPIYVGEWRFNRRQPAPSPGCP